MLRRNSLQWLGVILVSLIFFNACVPIQRVPAGDAAAEAATETTVVAEAGDDEEPPERGAVAEEASGCNTSPIDGLSVINALSTKDPDKLADLWDGLHAGFRKQDDGTWREFKVERTFGPGAGSPDIKFDVLYLDDKSPDREPAVPLEMVISLDDAVAQGIAGPYDVSCQAGQQQMVDAHNQVRREAGVTTELVWDPELAAQAADWSAKVVAAGSGGAAGGCGMGNMHSPPCGRIFENIVGENNSAPASPAQATKAWASEKQFYDAATGACTTGEVCGHYTTIINKDLTKIGCGIVRKPIHSSAYHFGVWTCQYK